MNSNIIKRFKQFIDSKGGPVPVSEKIDKHPNKFYVTFRGDTLPNSNTLLEIKGAYSDFDLNWLFTGVPSENMVDVPGDLSESIDIKSKEKEIEELKEKLLKAEGKIEGYQEMLSNVVPFSRPLDEEKIREKVKANFKEAHEEARIIALNYDELSDNYYPEISEIGFTPNWMKRREQNASRA